jgi:penicillin-binding protein-related factor A (putative recombinase)
MRIYLEMKCCKKKIYLFVFIQVLSKHKIYVLHKPDILKCCKKKIYLFVFIQVLSKHKIYVLHKPDILYIGNRNIVSERIHGGNTQP